MIVTNSFLAIYINERKYINLRSTEISIQLCNDKEEEGVYY